MKSFATSSSTFVKHINIVRTPANLNAFGRPKLRPLIYQPKDSVGRLAQNLYKADQANRLKKYFYNKYAIKNNKIININEENNEL